MFLVASGLFAMFFFNTLYIQRVLGYGPLEAGLAFLPFTAGIMVSAGLASKFAPRVGVRPVAIVGMVVTIAGMAAADADLGRRQLRRRRAAGARADVARPRRRVRAADADRDDRPRRRGPGSRLRALQHVAADRRRARARDPRLARGEQDGERDRRLAAEALVAGLPRRVRRRRRLRRSSRSWGSSPCVRGRDVERIEAEAAATAPAGTL